MKINKFSLCIQNISLTILSNNKVLIENLKELNKSFITNLKTSRQVKIYLLVGQRPQKLHLKNSEIFKSSKIEINDKIITINYRNNFSEFHLRFTQLEFWEIEQLLKIVLSQIFISEDTLLIHGSAIIKNDSFLVFIGNSGSGKSTIAELSGKEIIQDDTFGIRTISKDKVQIFTIPFRRDYIKKSFDYKLESINVLRKNVNESINLLTKSEQTSNLLSCVWSYDVITDNRKENNLKIIEILKRIAKDVTIQELNFSLFGDVKKLIC